MTIGTTSAFAVNYSYWFYTPTIGNNRLDPVQKTDSEQSWYLSTDRYAPDGSANTLASSNILGVKMHLSGSSTAIDNYHTFSNYVQAYRMNYIAYAPANSSVWLGFCKDSDRSDALTPLQISGRYAP